jgi:uncharacterized lipoprotein YajG
VKKLLLLAAATTLMAACSESSTAPQNDMRAAPERASHDLTCASGYIVAFDENGNPYCAPDPNARMGVAGRPRRP